MSGMLMKTFYGIGVLMLALIILSAALFYTRHRGRAEVAQHSDSKQLQSLEGEIHITFAGVSGKLQRLRLWYQAPKQARLERYIQDALTQVEIVQGDDVVFLRPQQKKVIRLVHFLSTLEQWQNSMPKRESPLWWWEGYDWLNGWSDARRLPGVKRRGSTIVAGHLCDVVELKEGGGWRMAVDQEEGLPLRIVQLDRKGRNAITAEFVRIKFNVPIPPAQFQVVTEPGWETIQREAKSMSDLSQLLLSLAQGGTKQGLSQSSGLPYDPLAEGAHVEEVSLSEARKRVPFKIYLPQGWGSPRKVEIWPEVPGLVRLTFVKEDKIIYYILQPLKNTAPMADLTQLQEMPEVRVREVLGHNVVIILSEPNVGALCYWQDKQLGVAFEIWGPQLSEEEFVMVVRSTVEQIPRRKYRQK